MLSTYQSYLFYTANPSQTLKRTTADPTVSRAQTYYTSNIGKVKTVDDFLNNSQLFNYAMKAYGLEDFSYGKAFMRKVLTSDLSDPHSFVNKLTDARYKTFAQAFSFDSKGQLTKTAAAQTSSQANNTLTQFTAATQAATSSESAYLKTAVAQATSVDDLTSNKRLLGDLLKAYGLSPYTSADYVKTMLESDESDPQSQINTAADAGFRKMAADFNVDASGTIAAQTTTQADHTLSVFQAANESAATAELAHMKTALTSLTSVDGLTSDTTLFGDVLTAYGLDPTTSPQTLTAALESDLSDPQSAARQSSTPGLRQLVADFNFDATGAVATQRTAQTQSSLKAMSAAYGAASGTDSYSKSQAAAETTYVAAAILKATSIDDIVKDPRIVSYIGKAFGEPKITSETLRSVLTSDTGDPKSKANVLGSDYVRMAQAFEFTPKGTIARESSQAAQSRTAIAVTNSAYIEQTVETNAGADNAGTQLALYFARKAPSITTVFQILADPALLKFAQTSFGLPTTSSSQNIDSQAALLQKKLKITDLKDPAKVKALVARFAALYDLANPSTAQSNVTALFSSAASPGS